MLQEDKQFLLNLARITLEYKESDLSHIPEFLLERGATFVNLYKNGSLVRSVGSVIPNKEIVQDVIDNILTFSKDELSGVKIEISLIKNLKKLSFENQEELFSQITPNTHGVLIEKAKKIATLLPSVWQQVRSKEEFLNQFCYKLKLKKDSWKTNATIFTYETESFRED